MWNTPQALWHIPERNVNALGFHDQMESVGLLSYTFQLILHQFHQAILLLLKALSALGAPLQPQLEDIIVPAALDHLVASVVADVVLLVGHEQILGRHLVAADEQTLQRKYMHSIIDKATRFILSIPFHILLISQVEILIKIPPAKGATVTEGNILHRERLNAKKIRAELGQLGGDSSGLSNIVAHSLSY